MKESQKELMDIPEFSYIYSLSITKIYSEINKKRLIPTKLGRRTYIRRVDAEAWLEKLSKESN